MENYIVTKTTQIGDILLEKGDKILREGSYIDLSQKIIDRTGMDVAPLETSNSELFIEWLNRHFNLIQELDLKGKVRCHIDRDPRDLDKLILTFTDSNGFGVSIYVEEFLNNGTDWSPFRNFSVYELS